MKRKQEKFCQSRILIFRVSSRYVYFSGVDIKETIQKPLDICGVRYFHDGRSLARRKTNYMYGFVSKAV